MKASRTQDDELVPRPGDERDSDDHEQDAADDLHGTRVRRNQPTPRSALAEPSASTMNGRPRPRQ